MRAMVAPGGSHRCGARLATCTRSGASQVISDPVVLGAHANAVVHGSGTADRERATPRAGCGSTARVLPFGAQAEEPVGEGLPHPAHRREVQSPGGGAGQVVEVEAGGHAEQLERPLGLARHGPAARREMAGESELPWAVRGS